MGNVAGTDVPLGELLITPNELLILGADAETNNLFYLPLHKRNVGAFEPLEGHNSGVFRIKMIRMVPMFMSLSGKDKIIRWSSFDPPQKLKEYSVDGVMDMAGAFEPKKIYLAKSDKSIGVIDFKTGDELDSKKNAHSKPVLGIAFIPHINTVITAGGKVVKIWDKDLKILQTLKDSKHPITGYVMYKMQDQLIGLINSKGLVFWK